MDYDLLMKRFEEAFREQGYSGSQALSMALSLVNQAYNRWRDLPKRGDK